MQDWAAASEEDLMAPSRQGQWACVEERIPGPFHFAKALSMRTNPVS